MKTGKTITIHKSKKYFYIQEENRKLIKLKYLQEALEMRLFYLGIKPSVAIEVEEQDMPLNLLKRYPNIIKTNQITREGKMIKVIKINFFKSEELKVEYINECMQSPKNLETYGVILGYPPIATKDFIQRINEIRDFEVEEMNITKKQVWSDSEIIFFKNNFKSKYFWSKVSYHGLEFICKNENINSCLTWLESNYNIPSEYQVGIKIEEAFKPKAITVK